MNTLKLLNEKGIEFLVQNNVDVTYVPHKNVYILNYQQIETNRESEYRKYHPVIRECRNLIVRQTPSGWLVLSRSFERFFNWTEHKEETELFTKEIEAQQVTAYEKLDGSLISLTYFDNEWHVFTRGSDADQNPFRGMQFDTKEQTTFGSRVRQYLPKDIKHLDTDYTYVFELCTPLAHITTYNKEFLALLTIIDKTTNTELDDEFQDRVAFTHRWRQPETFTPKSLADIYERLAKRPPDFEGYVLKHKSARMKLKQESYVALHHLGSKITSARDLVRVVVNGELDELKTAEFIKPFIPQLEKIANILNIQYTLVEKVWDVASSLNRKEFAKAVQDSGSALQWVLYGLKDDKFTKSNIRQLWITDPSNKDKLIDKLITSIEKIL